MNNNNKNNTEEKVFSVLLSEEELSMYSEFLFQREFARKDYIGLDEKGVKEMRVMRNKAAKQLKKARRRNQLSASKKPFHDADRSTFFDRLNDSKGWEEKWKNKFEASKKSVPFEYNKRNQKGLTSIKHDVYKKSEKIIADSKIRNSRPTSLIKSQRLKKVGLIGAGIATAAGLGYGAYKRRLNNNMEKIYSILKY